MKRYLFICLGLISLTGSSLEARPKKKSSPRISRKAKAKPAGTKEIPTSNETKINFQSLISTCDFKTLATATTLGLVSGFAWSQCEPGFGGLPASSQYTIGSMLIEKPLENSSAKLLGSDNKNFAFRCAYLLSSNAAYYLSQYVDNAG